jgi:hypothetical protein
MVTRRNQKDNSHYPAGEKITTTSTGKRRLLQWIEASQSATAVATGEVCDQWCGHQFPRAILDWKAMSQCALSFKGDVTTRDHGPGTSRPKKCSDYLFPSRPKTATTTTRPRTITVYRALRPRESLYDGLCPGNPNSQQSLRDYYIKQQHGMSSLSDSCTVVGETGQGPHRRDDGIRHDDDSGRFLSVSLQHETAVYLAVTRAVEDGQLPARVVKITLHLNEGELLNLLDHTDNDDDDSVSTTWSSCDSSTANNEHFRQHHHYHHHYHNHNHDRRNGPTSAATTTTTLFHVPSVARLEQWTGPTSSIASMEQKHDLLVLDKLDEICLTRPIPAADIDKVIILNQQDIDYFVTSHHHHHHSRRYNKRLDSLETFCQAYAKWPGRLALDQTRCDGQRLRIVELTTQLMVQNPQHQRHVQQILQDGGLVAIRITHDYHNDEEDEEENDDYGESGHGHVVVVYGQSRTRSLLLPIGYICPQHARILAPHHLANVRYRRYELPFQQTAAAATISSTLTLTSAKKLTLLLQMSLCDAKHVVERIGKTKIGRASIHFPDGPSFLSPGSL